MTAAITTNDARCKVFEDLRAKLALAGGFELHQLADGSYLVARWGLTRELADLDAVRQFLARMGMR